MLENPLLRAALEYAELRWPVVKLHHTLTDGTCSCGGACGDGSRGKHPNLGARWQDCATSDPATIERLWEHDPCANVGVMMGPLGGIIDVEFDDEEGRKTAAELLADGCFTPTWTSKRSVHRLFRFDKKFAGATVTKRRGLEFRIGASKACQSVFPPSVHPSGKQYQWLEGLSHHDVPVADLPHSLIELLMMPEADSDDEPEDASALCLAAMRRIAVKSEQDGSGRLFACACRCVEYDLTDEQAVDLIRRYETERPFPRPWSNSEIIARLRDAERKQTRGTWRREITNAVVEKNGRRVIMVPVSMSKILKRIRSLTGGWPKCVDSVPFVHEKESAVDFLEDATDLMGWLGETAGIPPRFINEPGCHTKGEVFSELRRTSEQFKAVELLPHEPPIAGHYYACSIPERGDGKLITQLVEMFKPTTEIDGFLVLALFATPLWGGRGGSRPLFSITSDDGRGVGKSTLAALVGYLYHGTVELSANEEAEVIKQRLLSPAGMTKRIAVLDNVKKRCFSSAELESFVTTPTISGKRMFVGEGERPNTLTWIVTMNGGSYSSDLAQRSVFLKISRPTHCGNWEEQARDFIDANRSKLIGDLIGFLRGERNVLTKYSRWGAWDADVLSRLPEPRAVQSLILERQGAADVELEESDLIEDFFRGELTRYRFRPDFDVVFIPSAIACKWLGLALNERFSTTASSRSLNQKIGEGKLKQLRENKCCTYGRGFIWHGQDAGPGSQVHIDLIDRIEIPGFGGDGT
jgi:hypothetical protein